MGPRPVDTFLNLIREAETVEGCVVNDSGELTDETGVLWFPTIADRYNVDVTLTLPSGTVTGLRPTLDDQDIVNDVEATRAGGSSARFVDETSVATHGRIRQAVTVNTEDDLHLLDLARWRVHLGTVEGMRFPSVSWDLRGSPELAEQWMACRLFRRIDVTGPPSQYPPDDIQTLLEGYTETLSAETWAVEANVSPYAPWAVSTWGSADPNGTGDAHYDTAGSQTAAQFIAGTDTSMSVATTLGPLWTIDTDDFPFNIRAAGVVLTVTAISGASSPQTFTITQTPVNGVTKTIPSGTPLSLATPAYYAL